MGARLFRPNHGLNADESKQVGFVIHEGSDFPRDVKAELEEWRTASPFIETPNRLTTRGKNVYDGEIRDFAFLNAKIQIEASMLGPSMLSARTYHLICTPSRCMRLVKDISAQRAAKSREWMTKWGDPVFVWEPMEGSCRPEEISNFHETLNLVNVFSPNENEIEMLFNGSQSPRHESISKDRIYDYCSQLLTASPCGRLEAIIVRWGASGCTIATRNRFSSIPAYHGPPVNASTEELAAWHTHKTSTWDVTGGGNAFLGGFCVGLLSWPSKDSDRLKFTKFEYAAIYGSVAASFAIEQVGMPRLSYRQGDGVELWNNEGQ